MSRFATLLRRTFGVMKEHVGTDHLGNNYYYIPEQKTWTGELKSSYRSANSDLASPNLQVCVNRIKDV